uniref:Uncharacterized protein n=1 Tax=Siphoviridae sp. ctgN495 TaxID=2825608 RepID=A0A8S5UCR3_9CAUD|nr:MAG TPA: Protein of unknown function (DUF1029) [Siphoviridae sp. ctgN495]
MRALRAYFLFLEWRGAIISLSQLFLFLFYIVHFIHSIISKILYMRDENGKIFQIEIKFEFYSNLKFSFSFNFTEYSKI